MAEPAHISDPLVPEEEFARAGVYSLIGTLLSAPPDQAVFDLLASIEVGSEETDLSWQAIKTAASIADRVELEAEYHALFIGLGRGELLPYASTYLTGFLQEQPLADVRQDFARLGFVRQEGVHEPEDHAGSLCQAMAALILAPDDYSTEEQHQFFTRHVGSWMSEFFADLAGAKQAVFYRSVANFSQTFMKIEKRYFSMEV